MTPILYLIPAPLGEVPVEQVLLPADRELVKSLQFFVVEELRTGRRYLSKLGLIVPDLQLGTLNEHTSPESLEALIQPMVEGHAMGLISEAGLPAVADPGADLVALAHKKGFCVHPMVGPSSLMLALMASGLNGQHFAFNGYLPVKPEERKARIKELERRSRGESQTQLFIETPYRNQAIFQSLLETCAPSTRITVAANLTMPHAFICTRTIEAWKMHIPDFEGALHKVPCVFLLLAN